MKKYRLLLALVAALAFFAQTPNAAAIAKVCPGECAGSSGDECHGIGGGCDGCVANGAGNCAGWRNCRTDCFASNPWAVFSPEGQVSEA